MRRTFTWGMDSKIEQARSRFLVASVVFPRWALITERRWYQEDHRILEYVDWGLEYRFGNTVFEISDTCIYKNTESNTSFAALYCRFSTKSEASSVFYNKFVDEMNYICQNSLNIYNRCINTHNQYAPSSQNSEKCLQSWNKKGIQ